MSRIGKQPITLPSGVSVSLSDQLVSVKGPKGELSHTFPKGVGFALADNVITVSRDSDQKRHRAMHGTARALVFNMVNGVSKHFEKTLEIHGTGYSATVSGTVLEMDIGFSNKIKIEIPRGIEVDPQRGRPFILKIRGANKQTVGQLAAVVRSKRPPSPYGDNKGIRYQGESIRKKAGKAFGEKK